MPAGGRVMSDIFYFVDLHYYSSCYYCWYCYLLLYYYYWYHYYYYYYYYYYYHYHHHHHNHHQHYWYHCLLLNSKARTGRRSSLDTTHRACSDADEHTHEPYDDARASKATAHSALADSRLGRAPFASAYLEPVFGQKLSVCFCTY